MSPSLFSRFPAAKPCLWALARLAVAALMSCGVQVAAQSLDKTPNARASRSAARTADFNAALDLAGSGNLAAAEAALSRGNAQKGDALPADIETGVKLVHLALGLRDRYDYKNANLAAQRALDQLNDAVTRKGGSATITQRAQAYETMAFIHERLFFNLGAAKAALLQAQQIDPGSPSAADKLGRIKDQEDGEARVRGKKD